MSSRWQSIARARRDGRALPPIVVLERPDGYYVLDGRHRVSVARALGHQTIDAWASATPSSARATPPNRETAMLHRIHDVLSTITRALCPTERVHFHAGDHGRPYLCENPRCTAPALHIAKG